MISTKIFYDTVSKMFKKVAIAGLYGTILISLFLIDYALGNGFVNMLQKLICKITCFLKKSIREEAERARDVDTSIPFNFLTLLLEIFVLLITRAVLQKYKFTEGRDRIDELLKESKEALRKTEDFLDKWRMRRIPNYPSYLDEEPQEIKPLKIEVPILHMAIIDSRGSKQQDRADAGDAAFCSDSPVVSFLSLVGENRYNDPELHDLIQEPLIYDNKRNTEINNRYLWAVEEEDPDVDY